jgi:C4-dicarboxylate transporter DctQ subunit
MLIRIVHHLEEGFIALLLALMTLITFSQVVARYVFETGFGWALELTTYLFAWLVLFGISYGIKVGAHIGIDILVRQLPHQLRRIVGLLAVLACCAYCIILLVGATGYVYKIYEVGIEAQDLPIPRWIPFIMLPIGLAMALLRLLQVAWRTLIGEQEGLRLADEAREAIEAVEGIEVVKAVETFEVLHPSARTDKQEKAP